MRNLPIKSPKVPTLKKALRRFHQSQRGRNSKPLAAKLTAEASLKEENKNIEGTVGHVTFPIKRRKLALKWVAGNKKNGTILEINFAVCSKTSYRMTSFLDNFRNVSVTDRKILGTLFLVLLQCRRTVLLSRPECNLSSKKRFQI